jgi:hypothetical protein
VRSTFRRGWRNAAGSVKATSIYSRTDGIVIGVHASIPMPTRRVTSSHCGMAVQRGRLPGLDRVLDGRGGD